MRHHGMGRTVQARDVEHYPYNGRERIPLSIRSRIRSGKLGVFIQVGETKIERSFRPYSDLSPYSCPRGADRASIKLQGVLVGNTRSNLKPAIARSVRYSFSVRSLPP